MTMRADMAPEPLILDDDVREGLRRMAERVARSASELANSALREIIRDDEALRASIDRGLADMAAGRTMDTEELRKRLEERRQQARR